MTWRVSAWSDVIMMGATDFGLTINQSIPRRHPAQRQILPTTTNSTNMMDPQSRYQSDARAVLCVKNSIVELVCSRVVIFLRKNKLAVRLSAHPVHSRS